MNDTGTVKRGLTKWKPLYLVTIYRCARAGLNDMQTAEALKVKRQTFANWRKTKPEIDKAMTMAREERREANLKEWVYERLAPELRQLWKDIETWNKEEDGISKIEKVMAEQGESVRQQLFLHALVSSNFNPSEAMKKVNITKRDYDKWILNSPDFPRLVEEIAYHKANFFEDGLVQLVREGNATAVVFANKTFNADRGYARAAELNVNHSGSIGVGVFDMSLLLPFMSENLQEELMEAIRTYEKAEKKKAEVLSPIERLSDRISDIGGRTTELVSVSGEGVSSE